MMVVNARQTVIFPYSLLSETNDGSLETTVIEHALLSTAYSRVKG
jgi:hypothetical protein